MRYFDFFWDFLPRSIAFVGAGLLLLGLAWLLRRSGRDPLLLALVAAAYGAGYVLRIGSRG